MIKLSDLVINYKSTRRGLNSDTVIMSNKQGDYLKIVDLGNNEFRFLDDNFPCKSRFFNTNIPIITLEDFERDMKRMAIDLPERRLINT